MIKNLNEATLTARLHKILEVIFPSFKALNIVHQESFTIKFGHHNVKVSNKNPNKYPNRAIFDMLLSLDGNNIMLVELKKEGHAINNEDISQGLSYARLIQNMPPLVLISNGSDNRLYDSYTMLPCNEDSIDIDFIKNRIQNSFKLATSEFKNAVNLLLNRQPELIGKVISQISKYRFDQQSGYIDQLDQVICKDFQIKRKIVRRIYKSLLNEEHVYGIVGHAFSGKTNVLYQFFREYGFQKEHYILYIDLKDQNISIFQQLAQDFSRETKDYINREKIREWFNSMLHYEENTRFILLVDNLNNEVSTEITNELIELIELFRGTNHRIIYTIDEWTYKNLAFRTDRNYKNLIGRVTKIFTVNDITDREFREINNWLYKVCKTIIPPGGHFCSEYRKVRVLRVIAATASKYKIVEGAYSRFETIANISLINSIAYSPIFTDSIHNIFKKLTTAFFTDKKFAKKFPYLGILGRTLGAVSTVSVIALFGEAEYQEIIESGVVIERNYKDIKVLIPKLPELMIRHGIDFLVNYLSEKTTQQSSSEMYKDFIDCCEYFPSSDIIGAGIMHQFGGKDIDLWTYLIQELKSDEPTSLPITKGTEILTFSKRYGHIKIKFESDMEMESLISQHLPHSILAQLVQYPMESEDNSGKRSYDFFVDLLLTLGSKKEFIHRVESGSFDEIRPVLTWEIPGVGTVASATNGVIETLVQSYQLCFLKKPEIIERLYERALEQKSYATIWRINLAMKPLLHITDTTLDLKARRLEYKSHLEIYRKLDEVTGLNVAQGVENATKVENPMQPPTISFLTDAEVKEIEKKSTIQSKKYGRNDKVNIKYLDGRTILDIKFKRIEQDYNNGKCTILTSII